MSTNGIMMNASFKLEASAITSGEAAGGTKTEKSMKATFATVFFGTVSKLGTNNDLSDKMQTTQKTEYSEAVQKTDGKVSDAAPKSKTPADTREVIETEAGETVKEITNAVEQVADKDLTKCTGNTVATGETEPTDPEIIEKVATLLNGLMDVIARILNTTVEETTEFMEENNILPTELTNPDVLRQMTLFFNNEASPLEMITNEELAKTFEEVTGMVEQLTSEFNAMLEGEGTEETAETLLEKPAIRDQVVIERDDGSKTILIRVRGKEETEDEDLKASAKEIKEENIGEKKEFALKAKTDETKESTAIRRPEEENTGSRHEGRRPDDTQRGFDSLFTQFADKIANAVNESEQIAAPAQSYYAAEIINQLAEQIKINITPDHTSLEMMLNPESLGKVSLGITSKNGVMTAELKCENQIAKEAIESQLITLKENIESQGIKVEAIEVTVSSFDFGQSKDGKPAQSEKQEDRSKRKVTSAAVSSEEPAQSEASHLRYAPEGNSTVNFVA